MLKINIPKIGKILKVEINFSVLKFMYLGQFVSDLVSKSKLGTVHLKQGRGLDSPIFALCEILWSPPASACLCSAPPPLYSWKNHGSSFCYVLFAEKFLYKSSKVIALHSWGTGQSSGGGSWREAVRSSWNFAFYST